MNLFHKALEMVGFKKLIKIPGKDSFDALTLHEVGLLIDSFLSGGDDRFDAIAFNDFLHYPLKNDSLRVIQAELNEHAFLPAEGDRWPEINREHLVMLSKKLKAAESGAEQPLGHID